MKLPPIKSHIPDDAEGTARQQDVLEYLTQVLREIAQIADAAGAPEVRRLVEQAYYEAGRVHPKLDNERLPGGKKNR